MKMVGKHPVQIEADVLVCTVRGEYTVEEIQEYLHLAQQITAEHGHCFLMSDISKMPTAPPETRRWAADWLRSHSIAGAAMFGNSLPARTLLFLLVRAVALTSGSTLPMVFVKTEHEARAWIAARRNSKKSAA